MKEKNMTALVSCFARGYHNKFNKYKIFDDYLAIKLLGQDYNIISSNMTKGILFFNQTFKGTKEETLRYIVDKQLSPSVLGRSIFTENSLENAIRLGVKQYLIFASGYDTYAYRNKNNIKVFEIDKDEMIADKIKRLDLANIKHDKVNYIKVDFTKHNWVDNLLNSNYKKELSFCSLLGISYYLTKEEFTMMLKNISDILVSGSTIVFDYPTYDDSEETIINQKLAKESDEEMKSKYSYKELENILEDYNLLIYELLDYNDMTNEYFYNYNTLNPNNKIIAPKGINYALVVKK